MQPATLTPARLRELALIGARAELERIYRAFPELRPHAPDTPPPTVARLERRRKRRHLTPADRKAISRRMRAYWSRRRAAA